MIEPVDVVCVIDSREQLPYALAPMRTVKGTLATGDYSVLGLEARIAIERKSTSDLLMCIGQERERFEKECQRLLAYETRAIVVEGSWSDLENGNYRAKVAPAAAVGSVLGWVAMGIPVLMAGNRERAEKLAGRLLFIAARRRWRELQSFAGGLRLASSD